MIRILTVCTGNICRSPYAERFLQNELDRLSPGSFSISSAGTHALSGQEMDERAAQKLREAGGSEQDFAARQITSEVTADKDLVLALTEEHRDRVVALSPRVLKRTYTVREFAAVLGEISANPNAILPSGSDPTAVAERWSALLRLAPFSRHSVRQRLQGNLDVTDPYRQDAQLYDRMVYELLPALQSIVEFESFHAHNS